MYSPLNFSLYGLILSIPIFAIESTVFFQCFESLRRGVGEFRLKLNDLSTVARSFDIRLGAACGIVVHPGERAAI